MSVTLDPSRGSAPTRPPDGKDLTLYLLAVASCIFGVALTFYYHAIAPDGEFLARAGLIWTVVAAVISLIGLAGTVMADRTAGGTARRSWLTSRWVPVTVIVSILALLAALVGDYGPPVDLCPRLTPQQQDGAAVSPGVHGECFGFTTIQDVTFVDPAMKDLSRAVTTLLSENPGPADPVNLTVIWIGPLTCNPHQDNSTRCDAPGTPYLQAETEDLQGLELARRAIGRVRVVIVNAGHNVMYADNAIKMIIDDVDVTKDWDNVVAIDGSDSREKSRDAINTLLGHKVPMITGTLTADDRTAGAAFLPDTPGYLQLTATNTQYAQDAAAYLSAHLPAGGTVYAWNPADEGDLYVQSQTRDLTDNASGLTVVPTVTLDDVNVCGGSSTPAGIFFAARWTMVPAFIRQVVALCKEAAPALLVGDGSMNRVLDSDSARKEWIGHPWPVVYYGSGWQCPGIDARAAGSDSARRLRDAINTAAADILPTTCSTGHSGNVGNHVSITWDEVMLAAAADGLGKIDEGDLDALSVAGYVPVNAPLDSTGAITVAHGRLTSAPRFPIIRECTIADGGPRFRIEDSGVCDRAYITARTAPAAG